MTTVSESIVIPEITHTQFLVLKSFADGESLRFNELARNAPLTPVKVGKALSQLVTKGLLRKPERGLYEIEPSGQTAIESLRAFYRDQLN